MGPIIPPKSGSFMAPAGGGGSNVMQGMAQGMPAPMQQGNAAPVPMPQAPMQQPATGGMIPGAPVPNGNPEALRQQEVSGIVKALQERLATHSQIDQARAGVHKFQSPSQGAGPLT